MTDIKPISANEELNEELASAVQASLDDELDEPRPSGPLQWIIGGLAVVVILGTAAWYLSEYVPIWTKGTSVSWLGTIEYPVYAIIFGLLGNALLSALNLRDRLSPGFRTEFLIKTGLVLLGASINFAIIVKAAAPAIAQATLLITSVFFITWWLGRLFGLDARLRALLSSAAIPEVRARLPGRLDHRDDLRELGGLAGCRPPDRHREQPAHLVPDLRFREHRTGTQGLFAAACGLAADRRVRPGDSGQPGDRIDSCPPVVEWLRDSRLIADDGNGPVVTTPPGRCRVVDVRRWRPGRPLRRSGRHLRPAPAGIDRRSSR